MCRLSGLHRGLIAYTLPAHGSVHTPQCIRLSAHGSVLFTHCWSHYTPGGQRSVPDTHIVSVDAVTTPCMADKPLCSSTSSTHAHRSATGSHHHEQRKHTEICAGLVVVCCTSKLLTLQFVLHISCAGDTARDTPAPSKHKPHSTDTRHEIFAMAGRHRVEELEHRCHELKEQQKLLETARSQLCARERLLNAWCGALCLLKDLGVIDVDSSQRCEELEQRLQRELSKISAAQPSDAHHHDSSANAAVRRNNCNSSCGTTNNNSISRELVPDCAHEGYATIAPAADPIAYMRKLLQQPVLTAAATMTSAEMAALQRECVLQSGVHSQLLHMSESPAQQALAIEKIAGIWDRYFHALLSLYLHGRLHVAEAMAVYNLETLKVCAVL